MSERSCPAQVGFACLHLSEISVHLAPDSSHRRSKHPHFLFCQHRAGVPGRCQSCPLFTSALGNSIVIYGGEVSFTTRSYLIYPALLSCKVERQSICRWTRRHVEVMRRGVASLSCRWPRCSSCLRGIPLRSFSYLCQYLWLCCKQMDCRLRISMVFTVRASEQKASPKWISGHDLLTFVLLLNSGCQPFWLPIVHKALPIQFLPNEILKSFWCTVTTVEIYKNNQTLRHLDLHITYLYYILINVFIFIKNIFKKIF